MKNLGRIFLLFDLYHDSTHKILINIANTFILWFDIYLVWDFVLTLNFHSILYALGFALTEHSKYTSSPSLMLLAFNVLPSSRETRGRSVYITSEYETRNNNIQD